MRIRCNRDKSAVLVQLEAGNCINLPLFFLPSTMCYVIEAGGRAYNRVVFFLFGRIFQNLAFTVVAILRTTLRCSQCCNTGSQLFEFRYVCVKKLS